MPPIQGMNDCDTQLREDSTMSAILAANPSAFSAGRNLGFRHQTPASTLSRLSSGSRVHTDGDSLDLSEKVIGRRFALESPIRDAVLASNLLSIV
jgi:hypothetical protein